MLQPKKSKFKKQFRGKMRGDASRGSSLDFGQYGLKSLGRGWLTDRQIEAASAGAGAACWATVRMIDARALSPSSKRRVFLRAALQREPSRH